MIGGDKSKKKDKWVTVVYREHPSVWWHEQDTTHLIVAIGPKAGAGLLTFYHDTMTLVLGVAPEEHSVYKDDPENPHHYRTVDCRWIWGRATEPYDLCLDYFGLGPLAEISWRGGAVPPIPVRVLGRVCRIAASVLDDVLDWTEPRFPALTQPNTLAGRLDSWLSVYATGWLMRRARDMDPCVKDDDVGV
jgi:hypothetical protein